MSIFDFFKRRKSDNIAETLTDKELEGILAHMVSVSVWSGENKEIFNREKLTAQNVKELLEQTLCGKYNRLVMELQFLGEGTFVKKLNKVVHKNWMDHVVILNDESKMVLAYVAKEKLKGYELIADYHTYSHKDSKEIETVMVAGAPVPEYTVHSDRKALDRGLKDIFSEIDTAADRLYGSDEPWHIIFLQGMNGYHKLCEQLGIAEES